MILFEFLDNDSLTVTPTENSNITDQPVLIDNFSTSVTAVESIYSTVFKGIIFSMIILAAVIGNLLVIISVFRNEKLRLIANSFIVSLAVADLLVATFVMPFNASQHLAGRWLFGRTICDVYNANDVFFSTASLLHLCCISVDRYIAITDPLSYDKKMTRRRVVVMLLLAWTVSAFLSHLPIHLHLHQEIPKCDNVCNFNVYRTYALISCAISFWTPATVMVFTYAKIYREARRQERRIQMLSVSTERSIERLDRSAQLSSDTSFGGSLGSTASSGTLASPSGNKMTKSGTFDSALRFASHQHQRRKLKREHKAAKTLGVIMGTFLFCWLPFFISYLLTNAFCSEDCSNDTATTILFWLGYLNSALNPIIYALYNRDFRKAFKQLLLCRR